MDYYVVGLLCQKIVRRLKTLRFGKINAAEFGGRVDSAEDAFKLVNKINIGLVELEQKRN